MSKPGLNAMLCMDKWWMRPFVEAHHVSPRHLFFFMLPYFCLNVNILRYLLHLHNLVIHNSLFGLELLLLLDNVVFFTICLLCDVILGAQIQVYSHFT